MISALARAYYVLRDPKYRELAESAAKFIESQLYDPDKKKLLRSFREGPGDVEGFVDDYRYGIFIIIIKFLSTYLYIYVIFNVECSPVI